MVEQKKFLDLIDIELLKNFLSWLADSIDDSHNWYLGSDIRFDYDEEDNDIFIWYKDDIITHLDTRYLDDFDYVIGKLDRCYMCASCENYQHYRVGGFSLGAFCESCSTRQITNIHSGDCAICLEALKLYKIHTLKVCNHIFHSKCIEKVDKVQNKIKCPLCRAITV